MNLIEEFFGKTESVMTFDNHVSVNTENGFQLLIYFSPDNKNCWVERIKRTGKNRTFYPFPGKEREGKWFLDGGLLIKTQNDEEEVIVVGKANKVLLNLHPEEIRELIDDIQDGEVIHELGYMKTIIKK